MVTTVELPRVAGLDEADAAQSPVWCSIPSEPGVAFLRCQCGRLTHLKDWDIASDGTVSPSFYHVEPFCDWHVFLKLTDWSAAK